MMTRACPVCENRGCIPIWNTVVSCRVCGMVYDCQPQEVNYSANRIYGLRPMDETKVKRTIEILSPFIGRNCLEIGCGNGELLLGLRKYMNVAGVDPSTTAVKICQEKGLDVKPGSVYEQSDSTYDLVILSHVLEHLQDPFRALVSIANSAMNPKGKLYIEVPDATRHLEHMTVPLQEFSSEHINHFSFITMQRLFDRVGLYPCATGTRSIPAGDLNGQSYSAMWFVVSLGPFRQRDDALPWLMQLYAKESERSLKEIAERVRGRLNGRSAIAWGAGSFGQHLLPLLRDRIANIVDSDSAKVDTKIAGITVFQAPKAGEKFLSDLPILIASLLNAESIKRDIAALGLPNEIVECA